jgi:xyloglucan-specific exo-beta-1,4-glucanase
LSDNLTSLHRSTQEQGVAYARTDIGGIYKLNADDTWTPLMDWVGDANWDVWGVDALALDPSDAKKLYLATGRSNI